MNEGDKAKLEKKIRKIEISKIMPMTGDTNTDQETFLLVKDGTDRCSERCGDTARETKERK